MPDVAPRRGKRVVLVVYGAIVAVAGVMGFVIGTIRPKNLDPELLAVIELPPTPFGMALYGMATVAIGLGLFLALVRYVSERFDTDAA